MHRHPAVAFLALLLFCHGCAIRDLNFESTPPGATVTVDSAQCTTPCILMVECDRREAVFVGPEGRVAKAELPVCGKEEARDYEARQKGEFTLVATAAVLAIVALGAYLVGVAGEHDPDEVTGNDEAWLVSITSGGIALLLLSAANYLDSFNRPDDTPTVHVDFDAPEALPVNR